jgi:O-antigen ligase
LKILSQYRNLILIILSWVVVGMYMGPVIYIYLPITLFVMRSRGQYMEMLLGFLLMLILSDSRVERLHFAANAKEIYIILLGIFLFTDRKIFTVLSRFYLSFIPFFIVAILCVFNSPSENSFNAIEKTVSYILLLFVVPNYVQQAYITKGREFYKILIYLGATILLIGFVFKFLNPAMVTREARYEGLFGNPNGLGIFSLLFFLLVAVVNDLNPNLFDRREKTVIYAAIIISIVLSGSRGSLFGILIYFLFSSFYKISPFLGSFVVILFIAGYSYISSNLVGVISSVGLQDYLRVSTLEAGSGRFIAWQFSWKHIQESFWLGRGFEFTNYLFDIKENVIYLQALGHQGNAHNSYITLWLDTGLIGVLAYIFAFAGSFIKAARKTRLALPIMYASLFSSFFESWLTASLNPFTIVLFIVLSILTSDVIIPAKAKIAVPVQ